MFIWMTQIWDMPLCVPFAWYSLVKGERIVRFVLNMLWMTQMKQTIWMKFDDMELMDEIEHINLVVHMDEILAMWNEGNFHQ